LSDSTRKLSKISVPLTKRTSKITQTLTLENRISDLRKACFGPPVVREPPVWNCWPKMMLKCCTVGIL